MKKRSLSSNKKFASEEYCPPLTKKALKNRHTKLAASKNVASSVSKLPSLNHTYYNKPAEENNAPFQKT